MNILQALRCAAGGHSRDRRKVREIGGDFYSVCTGCGKPMVRGIDGWVLTRDDPYSNRQDQADT